MQQSIFLAFAIITCLMVFRQLPTLETDGMDQPNTVLEGITVVSIAINLPGPLAAKRLQEMGARIVKVEPLTGDPLARYSPDWYAALVAGQERVALDLKEASDRAALDDHLGQADLLLTSNRPMALQQMRLGWEDLHQGFARLCQVAIAGYAGARENVAGHDLTYQASLGLLDPPRLPRALLADSVGAERAVSSALGLLLARAASGQGGYAQVVLADVVASLAEPLRRGLTTPGGLLGGGSPEYNVYKAKDGWVAVAALEQRFRQRLAHCLGDAVVSHDQYRAVFKTRSAADWQALGEELDIPIVAVQPVNAA
jgi:crotonobetainyl-CoA:carnitine CoA-transferase CaiB-like acyl-CoA transferase